MFVCEDGDSVPLEDSKVTGLAWDNSTDHPNILEKVIRKGAYPCQHYESSDWSRYAIIERDEKQEPKR